MNRCCFYGSLRRPLYNWDRFTRIHGAHSMKYYSTITIPGYRLYKIGNNGYPAAVRTGDNEDNLMVDLFDVDDTVYKGIQYMETESGYFEEIINIENIMYSIFLFDREQVMAKDLITSGDWLKYINNSRNNSI